MKKFLSLMILTLASASVSLAQTQPKINAPKQPQTDKNMQKIDEPKPFEYDNESVADANGVMKRGAGIGTAKKVSLAKAI